MITKNDEALAQAICYAWEEDKCISSGWHDFIATMHDLASEYCYASVDDRQVMDDTFKLLTGYDFSQIVLSFGGLYEATHKSEEFATTIEDVWNKDKEENGPDEIARGIGYLKDTYQDKHAKEIIDHVFIATIGHSLTVLEEILDQSADKSIYDLKEALESGEIEDERE